SSLNIEEWDEIQARVEADEEFAQRLQSQEREMYSEAKKARLLVELINKKTAWKGSYQCYQYKDDIQARVEADEEFVQRLQSKEREMYSEAEKARLLVELINERKRYFNIGSHTLKQLKSYSFDDIKNLFEITMRRVHTFVPIESESERVIPELAAGSSKRDAEEELIQ
ncbi:hypothetical protein Tco_1451538, partial [Tanacetum coccineum]